MKAALIALFCCTLLVSVQGFRFTSSQTTVVRNGNDPIEGVLFLADDALQRQQFDYPFSVQEFENYAEDSRSRYQTCPSNGCSNFFINYPMPDYGYRNGGSSGPSIEGVSTTQYSYTDTDGFTITLYVDGSNDKIVRSTVVGNGIDLEYTYSPAGYTANVANFDDEPNDPNCESVICNAALDLVLVIDSSGSISPANYTIEMNFSSNLVQNNFEISEPHVHVGIVTFSSQAQTILQLSSDEATVIDKLDPNTTPQQGGQTNIVEALEFARSILDSSPRKDIVPQAIVLITDGIANEPAGEGESQLMAIQEAGEIKAEGTLIYGIAVGGQDVLDRLKDIASTPTEDFTARVDDFDALDETISSIQGQVCTGGEVDSCETPCGANYFCGCGECVCELTESFCDPAKGVFNEETCSCDCFAGFTNDNGVETSETCQLCEFECQNGGVQNQDTCACDCGNYSGEYCESCDLDCNFEQLPGCSGCSCGDGSYFIPPDCETCGLNCVNGDHDTACTTCECDENWGGDLCNECEFSCTGNSHQNEDCTGCDCDTNYGGVDCTCIFDCGTNGEANSGCNGCICNDFWTGSDCNTCTRSSACNGHGEPNQDCNDCTCDTGYSGNKCQTCTWVATCSDLGLSANSDCTGCKCSGATTGDDCSGCSLTCDDTGQDGVKNCAANPSGTCNCKNKYTGAKCESCKSSDELCSGNGSVGAHVDGCPCTCDTNYAGEDCSQCTLVCENGELEDCSCTCPQLWSDETCSTCPLITGDKECKNGGTANILDGDCSCSCPTNYGGDYCEDCINENDCLHGTPDPDNGCACVCENQWSSPNCDQCDITCVNGSKNDECSGCDCDEFYQDGADCSQCTMQSSDCNGESVADDTCTCVCEYPRSGEFCDSCIYDCNGNGVPADVNECDSCICDGAFTVESNCEICDISEDSDYCNGRGTIRNPLNGCDICDCRFAETHYSGPTCDVCSYDCSTYGSIGVNEECNGCICDPTKLYTVESDCYECGLECGNGGVPNEDCTACVCEPQFDVDENCQVCDPDYVAQCKYTTDNIVSDDCKCECADEWSGEFCDVCDPNTFTYCQAPFGTVYDIVINGVPQCRCQCSGDYVGDDCSVCGLGTGERVCDSPALPVITDCSCHCPEYYAPVEGCRECILEDTNCSNGGVAVSDPNDPLFCDCKCPDDTKWDGRFCDECMLECPEHFESNENCSECVPICGDGIIAGDEECEILSTTSPEDAVCCIDCKFVTDFCNDGDKCTINDECSNGVCVGQEKECQDGTCYSTTCSPISGFCVIAETFDNEPCDDGNPCTMNDVCDGQTCKGEEIICGDDDDNKCTHESCYNGECLIFETTTCDDEKSCTKDECNPLSGLCVFEDIECEDRSDECMVGECTEPNGECIFTSTCVNENESDKCNTIECIGGECVSSSVSCDHFNSACSEAGECISSTGECGDYTDKCEESDDLCFTNSCDIETGECIQIPTIVCEDLGCRKSTCVNGQCEVTLIDDECIGDDKCRNYFCLENGECADEPICTDDDDNVCTEKICVDGECRNTVPVDCPATDCYEMICVGGNNGAECQSTGQLLCEDSTDKCKEPQCSDNDECIYVDIDLECPDDDDLCTVNGCVEGECGIISTNTCEENNLDELDDCIVYECNPKTGDCEEQNTCVVIPPPVDEPSASPSASPSEELPSESRTPTPTPTRSRGGVIGVIATEGEAGAVAVENDAEVVIANPVTTLVVAVGGSAVVGVMAFFGLLFAFNNTEEKAAAPLAPILEDNQMATYASESPVYVAIPEAQNNIIA